MAAKIIVEPEQLRNVSTRVDGLSDQYEAEYKGLYADIDRMKAYYSGEDSNKFVTKLEGFRSNFEKMAALMKRYAEFLRKAASSYESGQAEIIGMIDKLGTGN